MIYFMMNENKNKGNVLLIIIIVLLVVLISIGGVLIYKSYSDIEQNNNNINNDVNDKEENPNIDENNNSENSNNKDENVIKNLNMDSDLVDMINKKIEFFNRTEFDYTLFDNIDDKFGILYKKDKLLIKDLPAEIRMSYVVESFDLKTEAEFEGINDYGVSKYIINEDKFKQRYFKLLGNDVNYEPVEYSYMCPGVSIENGNIITSVDGCGGTWGPHYEIYKKYTKAEKNNNEIYLYEKIAFVNIKFVDYSNDYDVSFDIYSDIKHSKPIANNVINEKEIFSSKYIDKFSEYKYTFKLEDGNYIFYSVEKVK